MICRPLTVALIVVFHGVAGKPLREDVKGPLKGSADGQQNGRPVRS